MRFFQNLLRTYLETRAGRTAPGRRRGLDTLTLFRSGARRGILVALARIIYGSSTAAHQPHEAFISLLDDAWHRLRGSVLASWR
jgi:hypothetical protein